MIFKIALFKLFIAVFCSIHAIVSEVTTISYIRLKLSHVYYNLTIYVLHTNAKDKDKPEDRQEAILKIKCCDCQATYIGETRRNRRKSEAPN